MIRTATCMLLVAALAGCTGEPNKTDEKAQATAQPAATTQPVVTATQTAAPTVQKVELEIASIGDTMTFDKSELTVPAKAEVHLVIKNNSKLDVLPHNWVLVHEKTEAKVAAAGLALGKEKNYLPEGDDDMIAGTPLAPPGKTAEVTFTAPKYPGKYPYICTVPGHYIMMKGVLTVTPSS